MNVKYGYDGTPKNCLVDGCKKRAVAYRQCTLRWGSIPHHSDNNGYCENHIACDWFTSDWTVGPIVPLDGTPELDVEGENW